MKDLNKLIKAAEQLERWAKMQQAQYSLRELYFSELVDLERQLFVNPEAEHSMSVDADGGLVIKIVIK
jgi:hypothetical protein